MQSHSSVTKNFLTPKEAATYLGLHVNTIYKWMREPKRKFPVRKLSATRYLIPKEKFTRWANGD